MVDAGDAHAMRMGTEEGRRAATQHTHHCCSRTKSCESERQGFRVGDRSRGRFATPAGFPLHDGTPYRGLHVRRESLGFGLRLAQAKTGAMHGVSSLCGYLSDGHGSPGIFSILVDSSVASAPQVTPLETPREF